MKFLLHDSFGNGNAEKKPQRASQILVRWLTATKHQSEPKINIGLPSTYRNNRAEYVLSALLWISRWKRRCWFCEALITSTKAIFSHRNATRINSKISLFIHLCTKRLRWAGHLARMDEGGSAFKILTGKPTGKRPLGRSRRRQEDNITMDLEEIGINAGNWVDSAQDRNYWRALVNAALNLRVP